MRYCMGSRNDVAVTSLLEICNDVAGILSRYC